MPTLPLSDSQLFLIMWHSLFGGAPLCYHFTINGPLNREALQRSIQRVVKANPILSSIFEFPSDGETFSAIQARYFHPKKIELSFRKIDPLNQREEIEKEHIRLLNKKTQLDQWPLIEFTLFELGENHFHFFMGIDHVISDGLSSLEILHQIFSHYSGEPINTQSPSQYRQLIEKLEDDQLNSSALETVKSFQKNAPKAPFFWNPENRTRDRDLCRFQTKTRKLSKKETDQLLSTISHFKGSLYSLLVATYSEVLGPSSTSLQFTLPTSGRISPGVDLGRTIGCFAQALTLHLDTSFLNTPFSEKITYLNEKIQQGLAEGIDTILTKNMATALRNHYKFQNGQPTPFAQTLFQSSIKSNLYVSFTGQSPLQNTYGPLSLSNYCEGTFNNSFAIDFMHTLFDQKLHLFANFNSYFFSPTLIDSLLDKIVKHLTQLTFSPLSQKNLSIPTCPNLANHILFSLIAEITSIHLTEDNLHDDLEGCFGIDSLTKIRLVTAISKTFDTPLDKGKLLQARTLSAWIELIDQSLNSVSTSYA